jgi:hypothetical protein
MAILTRGQQRLIALIGACASISAGPAPAQTDGLTESDIKAGYLFNFTKFVEWPSEAFANASAPIVVGIVGANPFGKVLADATAGKTVNGRAVVSKQFQEEGDLRSCQILFVSPSEKGRRAEILGRLKGANVLTVGEGDGFTQAGGMIAFVVEGNKVRLLINLEAASEARLKISAKVIAVARLVGRQSGGRN